MGWLSFALVLIVPVLIVVFIAHACHITRPFRLNLLFLLFPLILSHSNEAVLIIQAGGRVEYINHLAREWFGSASG